MKMPRKQITGGIAQVLNVMQSSSWRNRVSFDLHYATFVTRCSHEAHHKEKKWTENENICIVSYLGLCNQNKFPREAVNILKIYV